ncbi:S-layer homology domain-containing protein [Cohnella faecalis]|uniref:S-layer homology domain-containing protein n=1 Tax=Cohnella faecalis TaxID=2315694 RepID=A0A398CCQ5_9BACL|nr:S-layer homology domain-containing protein [Cohnella faecalis]RIE00185.1 S-layer homology domain-containing protein [Cohnella faecalis]
MIARAIAYANPSLQASSGELRPTDSDHISSWAEDAVNQALELGIIKGDQTGNFKPKAEATRAEMVTLLSCMLQNNAYIVPSATSPFSEVGSNWLANEICAFADGTVRRQGNHEYVRTDHCKNERLR